MGQDKGYVVDICGHIVVVAKTEQEAIKKARERCEELNDYDTAWYLTDGIHGAQEID
jgi:hypothetical protein